MKYKFYRLMLVLLLVVAIALFGVVVLLETNYYYVHTPTTKFIKVNGLVDEEKGGGYVALQRDNNTPLAYEYVSLQDGKRKQYFSIDEDENVKIPVFLSFPSDFTPGTYYVGVEILLNNDTYTHTIKIRVR